MNTFNRVKVATRNAIFTFKQQMFLAKMCEDYYWKHVDKIPHEGEEERVSKERGGIFYRVDNVVYHALYHNFTKCEFPSIETASQFMKQVDIFVED